MADATYEVLEFRAVVKPSWTELYILCGPTSDGTLGVQGWHKTVIPPAQPALDALRAALVDATYLTEWDVGAPE
jgi:hypothetical protein